MRSPDRSGDYTEAPSQRQPVTKRRRAVPLAWRSAGKQHAVLAGALGGVHRPVGAVDSGLCLLAIVELGDAGAEGDQQALVVGEEIASRQLALQAGQHGRGLRGSGFRQQNDEFLAAVAADDVGRAQAFARYLHQMLERGVACLVSEGVVDVLEAVDVEYGNTQRFAAPPAARCFADQGLVDAAAVEGAGQRIVADQFAGLVEFTLQVLDAQVRSLDL